MIRISRVTNGYCVVATDQDGRRALSAPLHRLFLRGNLGGELPIGAEGWLISGDDDPPKVLRRLIEHFEKYGIVSELDEKSATILKSVDDARQAYQTILKSALSAKRRPSEQDLTSYRALLSQNFRRELTDLQLQGVNHLLQVQNGANLSVPGSGKTSVVLAYFDILRTRGEIDSMLVIGPGSCFDPWETENVACFRRPPNVLRLAGRPRVERHEAHLLAASYRILLTTYHSMVRDMQDLVRLLRARRFLVVLDESHYVKRPQGGILADAVLKLAPYARRRVILTGTPMPNGLPDLWTQFTFLWHDQLPLGTVDAYLGKVEQRNKKDALIDAQQRLAPLFFRVTKHQLGLPRPSFHVVRCEMSPLQKRIYHGVSARFLSQIGEAPRDRESLREWRRARAVRLIQIASNPSLLRSTCDEFHLPPMDLEGVPLREAIMHYWRYEFPAKIRTACEIVRGLCENGRKVIVWSTFIHNLRMIANQMKDFSPIVVHGGIPIASTHAKDLSREQLIQKFKTETNSLVLIANPAACAESISLHTVCHNAVYVDRTFNCAHYLQSLDRIHRLGLHSDDRTSYHLVLATGSIDEAIDCRLKEKVRNMRDVVEARFPGELPGYWSEDLGDEEERDFDMVEDHIRGTALDHVRKA